MTVGREGERTEDQCTGVGVWDLGFAGAQELWESFVSPVWVTAGDGNLEH